MHIKNLNISAKSSSAIIIFLGWAMDDRPFANLHKDGYDVILIWGTQDEDFAAEYQGIVCQYSQVVVIAWSYGVAVANSLISEKETLRIAVNGTPTPVSDTAGIPRLIFALTLRNISESNILNFYDKTLGQSPMREAFMLNLPQRNPDELKADLVRYKNLPISAPNKMWDKVYIADNDAIIPPANQANAWAGFDITHTDGSHFPDFQEIIDRDIIDKALIARRFAGSASGYETEAEVQLNIAKQLNDLWRNYQNPRSSDVLEIGVGTGFLTRQYSADVDSSRLTLLDLAPVEHIQTAARKAFSDITDIKFVSADAEQYLADCQESSLDTILSSSTIQWFASPRRLFANVAKVLRPGGIAAISTFESGTYEEISSLTGRSLDYHTLEQFVAMLPDSLQVLDSKRETSRITFDNGRNLLKHIKMTGVNALSGTPLSYKKMISLMRQLDECPHLTYRHIYLIIKKL